MVFDRLSVLTIRIHHTDRCNASKMMALSDHLRADQYIDGSCGHGIDGFRQAIELVLGSPNWDAGGEIAGHDGAAGSDDHIGAAQEAQQRLDLEVLASLAARATASGSSPLT